MEVRPIQTNFTSGELSPLTKGLVDVKRYFNGAEVLDNFIVWPQGGAQRRPGTVFVSEVKRVTDRVRLQAFEFNAEQSYCLEFGDHHFRIKKDGAVLESQLSSGQPLEVALPYGEDEIDLLKFAQSADVLFVVHPRYPVLEISRTDDVANIPSGAPTDQDTDGNHWFVQDTTFRDGPYLDEDTSDTTMILSAIQNRAKLTSDVVGDFTGALPTTWIEYVLDGIKVVGRIVSVDSGEVMTIEPFENIVDPATVDTAASLEFAIITGGFANRIRSTVAIWSLETENSYMKVEGVWYHLGTHITENEAIHPGSPAASYSVDCIEVLETLDVFTTTGTITRSDHIISAELASTKDTFETTRDTGRLIRFRFVDQQVPARIVSVTDAKTATLLLQRMMPRAPRDPAAFLNDAQTPDWRFGAFYDQNHPRVVSFHESRLILCASPAQPHTIWFSKSADLDNFAPTEFDSSVVDSSAITYTFDTGKINAIRWCISGPVLLLGTDGTTFQVKPESLNEALTPANFNAREQTAFGTQDLQAERIGQAIIYIQRGSVIAREMVYSFDIDSHVANELSIVSEHIFRDHSGVVDIAYQRHPYTRIWFVCGDGCLVCLTYEPQQEVVAFTPNRIGGEEEQPFVEAVEVVSEQDGTDRLYMIVRRTVDGNQKRYCEFLSPDFRSTETIDPLNMIYLDSSKTITLDPPANSAQGFLHLKGTTCGVVADGAVRPDITVGDDGVITFQGNPASVVTAGWEATSTCKTMPLDTPAPTGGTGTAARKNITKVAVRVYRSIGMEIGTDEDDLTEINFRETNDEMDIPPALFDGVKEISVSSRYGLEQQIVIRQSAPYPLNILSIAPVVHVYR